MALGVTFSAPDERPLQLPRPELEAKIKVALGGRAAEEIVFGDITTGAESDIQQLTQIARYMVGRWGMSQAIGPVAVLRATGGRCCPALRDLAEHPGADRRGGAADRGRGVRARCSRSCGRTVKLDALAEALLEHETLDEDDAYAAAGVAKHADGAGALAAAARSTTPDPANALPTFTPFSVVQ